MVVIMEEGERGQTFKLRKRDSFLLDAIPAGYRLAESVNEALGFLGELRTVEGIVLVPSQPIPMKH